jgi:hypothetical protein
MPTCKVCGETKDVHEFIKNIGAGPLEEWNIRYCKECSRQKYKQSYTNPKRRKALNRASKQWKQKNPERHAELAREYRQRNPEKTLAQNRLNYAVRKGRIKRLPCEVCGATENVHAHHVSYKPEDWYNVRWLCHVCHKLEHD